MSNFDWSKVTNTQLHNVPRTVICTNRDGHQVYEPIPHELAPTELPEFRDGLHFAPDDEYGYGV